MIEAWLQWACRAQGRLYVMYSICGPSQSTRGPIGWTYSLGSLYVGVFQEGEISEKCLGLDLADG